MSSLPKPSTGGWGLPSVFGGSGNNEIELGPVSLTGEDATVEAPVESAVELESAPVIVPSPSEGTTEQPAPEPTPAALELPSTTEQSAADNPTDAQVEDAEQEEGGGPAAKKGGKKNRKKKK